MDWDATAYDAGFGFVTAHGSALLDLLDVAPPARVIDIGCGTGAHAAQLAKRGFEVLGVDLDPAMLERAARLHPGVRFLAADVQDLRLKERFDAAISNAALHWIPDQAGALRSIRSVLVPGAPFVAEMGGRHNVEIVDAALESATDELGLDVPAIRKFFPSVAEESALLEAAGFDISMVQWFPRPTRLAEGLTAADWTRLFRADVWAAVPEGQRDGLAHRIDQLCTPRLRDDAGWFIDYHRLRFVCHAV